MFKYSYPGSMLRGESRVYNLAATDVAGSVEFDNVSKGIIVANTGPNIAYITFDDETVATTKFPIFSGGYDVVEFANLQVSKLNAICANTQTAGLRIIVMY